MFSPESDFTEYQLPVDLITKPLLNTAILFRGKNTSKVWTGTTVLYIRLLSAQSWRVLLLLQDLYELNI